MPAPTEFFESLDTVMAINCFLNNFYCKICLIFLLLILSPSPKLMHFVRMF